MQQSREILHQRIGRPDFDVAAQPRMRLGLREIAEAAVRERERIMHHGRTRVRCQRLLEALHGAAELTTGQGRATLTGERRHRLRLLRDGPRKDAYGRISPAPFEVHVAEPDERREVAGCELERALERLRGLLGFAAGPVHVAEIIRPPPVVRRQRLRVQIARLGGVEVLGCQKQIAHVAVGSRHLNRCRRRFGLLRQRRVRLTHLLLYGRLHA